MNHIDLINNTITLDLGNFIAISFGLIMVTVFCVLFFLLSLRLRQLLDRYRLKYTFDREIERKEPENVKEDRLDKREKYFRRRVFKD